MQLRFTVTVELSRESGKFASKDEFIEQIIAEIEGVDPGTLEGENEGVYNVDLWEVEQA